LTGYFLRQSHIWAEKSFRFGTHFEKVLEVGAGTGEHIKHVRHSFGEYWITDLNPPLLDRIELPADLSASRRILVSREDASHLSFPNRTFDRLVATHVLEHLVNPHEVLREWIRVLKPGGVMTLVLPCDPGVLWRLGRYTIARRKFIKAGLDYDYWMAREHVNPINNLVSFIRYYFDKFDERWLPSRVASIDLNLFYITHIINI
jgi:phosphatidylethanolamine/phosphatidyl-N-methylethanolamine N-methyltransferase